MANSKTIQLIQLGKLITSVACACTLFFSCAGCASPSQDASDGSQHQVPVPADAINNVGEYLQMPLLAGGCEVASLACALESMGFEVDVDDLVEQHLNTEGSGLGSGYMGSPYVFGAGYPPVLAKCANSFFGQQDSSLRAVSLNGYRLQDVLSQLDRGYPVMVWTTMEMMPAIHTETYSDGFEWYDNEHCVVVYGVEGDDVLVSDPLDGLVKRDRDQFGEIFEDCGGMAVIFYEVP